LLEFGNICNTKTPALGYDESRKKTLLSEKAKILVPGVRVG